MVNLLGHLFRWGPKEGDTLPQIAVLQLAFPCFGDWTRMTQLTIPHQGTGKRGGGTGSGHLFDKPQGKNMFVEFCYYPRPCKCLQAINGTVSLVTSGSCFVAKHVGQNFRNINMNCLGNICSNLPWEQRHGSPFGFFISSGFTCKQMIF